MGVSLGYFSTKPVSPEHHRQLLALAAEANESYEWWCESIWIAETLNDGGCVFGFTKLFCLIDDGDTDTYMACLDVWVIVRFLAVMAERLGLEWRLEIAGAPLGAVTAIGPDAQLQRSLTEFLDVSPGNCEALGLRTRAEILAEWSHR